MRVALVFPPFFHPQMYNLPPLGLINLGTALGTVGHEAVIVDLVLAVRRGDLTMGPSLYEECARLILGQEPELVAFGAQCTTYPALLQIAKRLRILRPGIKIIVGGHNASFLAEQTLSHFPFIDAVVRGEGEKTLPELVEQLSDGGPGAGVPGVTCRHEGVILANAERELIAELDSLPLPDYGLAASLESYRAACELPRRIAILEIGRGCPHRCVYCSESAMWRRRTRTFSVDRLMKEMRTLRDGHGAECFLLAYDQFTADRRFAEAFCRAVIDEGLSDLPWYCISRLDTVDADLLQLMLAAGCESMCYGIDSGSKRTLDFIRKSIDASILFQRVRETTDQGLVPTLSFVIGFPEEERSDIDATLELALMTAIQGNCNPLFQLPTVLPGTELHRRYVDKLVREVDTYFALGLEFDEGYRLATDEELIDSSPSIFSSFYNLPNAQLSLRELDLLARFFPLALKLYPKSFLLLSRATGKPISLLFGDFLQAVAKAEGQDKPQLSAAECYRHFHPFAEGLLADSGPGWRHLPAIIAYETKALEAGKFANAPKTGNIDLNALHGWRPRLPEGVLIASYAYNVPAIIDDLKAGEIRGDYPPETAWMIFRQEEERLEVTEVNDFGFEFLGLCDGANSLEKIAERLYPLYGRDMTEADFARTCREAASELKTLHLLESNGQKI